MRNSCGWKLWAPQGLREPHSISRSRLRLLTRRQKLPVSTGHNGNSVVPTTLIGGYVTCQLTVPSLTSWCWTSIAEWSRAAMTTTASRERCAEVGPTSHLGCRSAVERRAVMRLLLPLTLYAKPSGGSFEATIASFRLWLPTIISALCIPLMTAMAERPAHWRRTCCGRRASMTW